MRFDNSGGGGVDTVGVGRVVVVSFLVAKILGKTSFTRSVILLTTPSCRACNCWCLRWAVLRLTCSMTRILSMAWGKSIPKLPPPPRSTPLRSTSSSSSVPEFFLVPPPFTRWCLTYSPDGFSMIPGYSAQSGREHRANRRR